MKLRNPLLVDAAALALGTAVPLWNATLRCRTTNRGEPVDPWDPQLPQRFICVVWHESLVAVTRLRLPTFPLTALISPSADGELLAKACRYLGVNSIRGSSSHHGVDAVDEVLRTDAQSHLIIAPDGPRGPRHVVKRGVVYLSCWSGLPIVPLGVGFSRAWRLKSWDRLAIPQPFSQLTFVTGPIILPPAVVNKRTTEAVREDVEQSLLEATAAAQGWADTGQEPQPIDGGLRRCRPSAAQPEMEQVFDWEEGVVSTAESAVFYQRGLRPEMSSADRTA